MTENEAIEILTLSNDMKKKLPHLQEVYEVAVKALQEIQQYRSIGTVEECRAAVEKQRAKKPIINRTMNVYFCPICERRVNHAHSLFCSGCGQAIDWPQSENEKTDNQI